MYTHEPLPPANTSQRMQMTSIVLLFLISLSLARARCFSLFLDCASVWPVASGRGSVAEGAVPTPEAMDNWFVTAGVNRNKNINTDPTLEPGLSHEGAVIGTEARVSDGLGIVVFCKCCWS